MTNSTNKAKNIANKTWNTSEGVAHFQSSKAYGVLNAEGKALSSNGISPAVYVTMKVAKEIAEYCNGFADHSWITLNA